MSRSSAAGKAARLVHAVAYVAMRECTRRSRLAGSAGEAAEGVVQPANAGASLGAQAVRDGGLQPAIHLFHVYKRHVR